MKKDKTTEPLHIASCSFGKDSIATLLLALIHNEPIDRVVCVEVMFDNENNITGELPEHINWVREVAIPKLDRLFNGRVQFDIVRPRHDYKHFFFNVIGEKTKDKSRVGKIRGYLIGGRCKMNGEGKIEAIKRYYRQFNQPVIQYVGIAADETERLKRMKKNTISLLDKYHFTEKYARELCEQYDLLSPQYTLSTRNGCWFCPNMKMNDRCKFRKRHPEMWQQLVELSKTPNKTTECFAYDRTFDEVCRQMDFNDRQQTIDFDAAPDNFVHSDEDCCNKCNCMIFDIFKRYYCIKHKHVVQPYNAACADMERILQGFGE